MNKLYRQALQKAISQLGLESITPSSTRQSLKEKGLRQVSESVFHRMNRQDLKGAVKVPCPVNK